MKKLFLCLVLCFFLPAKVENAYAGGIPVIDSSNLAQNVMTALHTLKSTINEAVMIANQLQSLENEFKNLTKLDFNIIDEFVTGLENLFEEMGSVHGLMQDLVSLDSRFEELYPEFNKELRDILPAEGFLALDEALSESRRMMKGAARTGASVLENLPRSASELDKLLVDSSNAVGILQAAQAGNQIAATVSSNLMSLNALLANYSQAHMSVLQRMNEEDALTRNRLQNALRGIDVKSSAAAAALSPY